MFRHVVVATELSTLIVVCVFHFGKSHFSSCSKKPIKLLF